ncbi:hypothetical protein Tco_0927210 [Tanacetum coccineum]
MLCPQALPVRKCRVLEKMLDLTVVHNLAVFFGIEAQFVVPWISDPTLLWTDLRAAWIRSLEFELILSVVSWLILWASKMTCPQTFHAKDGVIDTCAHYNASMDSLNAGMLYENVYNGSANHVRLSWMISDPQVVVAQQFNQQSLPPISCRECVANYYDH